MIFTRLRPRFQPVGRTRICIYFSVIALYIGTPLRQIACALGAELSTSFSAHFFSAAHASLGEYFSEDLNPLPMPREVDRNPAIITSGSGFCAGFSVPPDGMWVVICAASMTMPTNTVGTQSLLVVTKERRQARS